MLNPEVQVCSFTRNGTWQCFASRVSTVRKGPRSGSTVLGHVELTAVLLQILMKNPEDFQLCLRAKCIFFTFP